MNYTIVIPARNEEEDIADVIKGCLAISPDIYIVDGHSTDRTREIAASLGAKILFDRGRGKGDAIRFAIENINTDILVFIDADGSHDPNDIPKLVAPIIEGRADIVVGSRFMGGSDELHGDWNKFFRMVGSGLITQSLNWRFHVGLSESQNGFRAVRRDVALKLNLKEDITTIEQEMTIKALKGGYKIFEVPAHEYARRHGESKISLKKVAFRYVWSWLKYLIF